jgi:vancomycin resistance protein YoaR
MVMAAPSHCQSKLPPRITDDVGALGITTRLGVGVSNFSGSDAARATNIKLSAGYLNDTVVAPGGLLVP